MAEPEKPKIGRIEVYWFTVSYRNILLVLFSVLFVGAAIYLYLHPELVNALWAWLESSSHDGEATRVVEAAQPRFITLDGTVRVKKRDAVEWINADYNTPLAEGDIVQTSPNGIARIEFIDGTTYVVKPETLIVIQQNAALANRATRVAVEVSSGAVDLSTGTWNTPESSSVVLFENAEARMQQNTRAAIRQDPNLKIHEMTVSHGTAMLARGAETIQIGPYERASFVNPGDPIRTEKVMAPPKLARPANLVPIISSHPQEEVIPFEWEPVEKAVAYQLVVSTSPLMTSPILDRQMPQTNFPARGLKPGDYYWTVKAIDAKNQKSQESEQFRFSLNMQPASDELLLAIDSVIQHGRVIEIVGRTEPGALVSVNAEPVANVTPDGRFKHFTSPLPSAGPFVITIVSQNARGEVVMQKKQVLVE